MIGRVSGPGFRSLFFLAVIASGLLLATSIPARAVVITVGGTDYDVRFFSNGFQTPQPSFLDNSAALQATPWWGNETLATSFANAYLAQAPVGSFDVSNVNDFLMFAFGHASPDVELVAVEDTVGVTPTAVRNEASRFTNAVYAYTVPIAVPEIDGNALAKALFCLMALGLWLRVRRERAVRPTA